MIESDNKTCINFYNIKLICTGDRIEIYKYDKPIKTGHTNNSEGRKRGIKGNANSRNESLNIARNKIIRIVESNKDIWSSFITLTYKENMEDIEISKKDIRLFLKKVRNDFEGFKFLYVIEKQARGAFHYHIITNLKLDTAHEFVNVFNERYWGKGFIYIQQVDSITNIAKYISVYLTKDLIETYGKHVYSHSRGLNQPLELKCYDQNTDVEILKNFQGYEVQYTNEYQVVYRSKMDGEFKESNVKYYDLIRSVNDENNR